MNKIKNILFTLFITIFLILVSQICVFAQENQTIEGIKTIFSLDYDNNQADLIKLQSPIVTPEIETDSNGNIYAKINPAWGVCGYRFTNEVIDLDNPNAVYKISYDFKLSTSNDYAKMSNIALTNMEYGSQSGKGISSAFSLLRACSETAIKNQFSVGNRHIPGAIYNANSWYSFNLTFKTSTDKTKWEYKIVITDKNDSAQIAQLCTYDNANEGGWSIPDFNGRDIDTLIFGCGDTVCIDNILVQSYEVKEAALYFDESTENKNIEKTICLSPASDGIYETKDGVKCITIGKDICLYLNIDLNDDVFDVNQRQGAEITVKYYDEGAGHFTLRYNNGTQEQRNLYWPEKVQLTDTKTWKTYTFKLSDVLFNNSTDGCDFAIVGYSTKYGYSESPVYISGVHISYVFPEKPIKALLKTEQIGNILDKENNDLYLNLENVTGTTVNAEVEFNIYAEDGELLDQGVATEGTNIEEYGKILIPINTDIIQYGAYKVEFELSTYTSNNNIFRQYTSESFSYSIVNKLSTDELPNENIGVCLHNFGRNVWDYNKELLQQIGISSIRDSLTWQNCETEAGVLSEPEGAGFIIDAHNIGLDNMLILGSGNSFYTATDDSIPVSDEEIKAWIKYVDWVSTKYSDVITYYEIWNEANFRASVSEYYKLLSVTYPILKNNDPDAMVCGMVTAQVDLTFIEEVLKLGGGQYMDAVSVHPYDFYEEGYNSWWKAIRDDVYKRHISELRDLLDKYNLYDIPIIISEVGISTADCITTERLQAAELVQLCALTAQQAEVEKIFLYDFQNDSYNTGEENNNDVEGNFGLINHWVDIVPYSAKPSYIAIAGYNKLLGNSEYIDGITFGATSICRFRRNADNKDVVIMWTDNSNDSFSIDLGSQSIEILDMYTNITENKKSESGVYSFVTTPEPIYIVGDIDKIQITENILYDDNTVFYEDFETAKIHTLHYYSGTEEQTKSEYVSDVDNKYLDVKTVGDWSILGFNMQELTEGEYDIRLDVKFSHADSYTCLWLGDIKSADAQKGFTGCFGSLSLINTENGVMYVCGQEIGVPQADVWYNYNLTINTKRTLFKGFKINAQVTNASTKEIYLLDTYIDYSKGYYSGFPSDRNLNKLMTSGSEGICIDNISIKRISGKETEAEPSVRFNRVKSDFKTAVGLTDLKNSTKIWLNVEDADVKDIDVKIFSAYYDENGKMLDVDLKNVTFFEDGRNIVDFYVDPPIGCESIKFMCLNDNGTLTPMDNHLNFKKGD